MNTFYLVENSVCLPWKAATVSAVVKQIFPPTIQQIYGNKYNRASGVEGLVLLHKNAGRALVMPEVQQLAELDSSAGINVPVLPDCGGTRMQGHSRVLRPPPTATSQGSPADTRDDNSTSASLCDDVEQNRAQRGRVIFWVCSPRPQLRSHPPPRSASLLTRVS